jgi:aspartyl-tRNA(Asn)/glutamyl-tRNA(Gln) amidotransferase subunit C
MKSAKKVILSDAEVTHVADLANLPLKDKDREKFKKQLSDVIGYVNKLKMLRTAGVEPTSQITNLENVFREDRTETSLSHKEAITNAKSSHNGFFKVKAIFEE